MINHNDPIAERIRLLEILRRQQRCYSEVLEAGHQIPDGLPAPWIKPGSGLIEKHHLRTNHQTARNIYPPPHPAGVRSHAAIRSMDQIELAE
jgi:hypothetical protein